MNDSGNGRPHFKNRDSSAGEDTSGSGGSSAPSPPAGDPDRPTLRRRADSSSSPAAASSSSADNTSPETAIVGADPDRPHIAHGQQTPTNEIQPAQLTGVPSGLQQMIAGIRCRGAGGASFRVSVVRSGRCQENAGPKWSSRPRRRLWLRNPRSSLRPKPRTATAQHRKVSPPHAPQPLVFAQ